MPEMTKNSNQISLYTNLIKVQKLELELQGLRIVHGITQKSKNSPGPKSTEVLIHCC